jgi:hypothetical protein
MGLGTYMQAKFSGDFKSQDTVVDAHAFIHNDGHNNSMVGKGRTRINR